MEGSPSTKTKASHSTSQGPTPPEQRILTIDILRGFALFGVLLANLLSFAYPAPFYEPLGLPGLDDVGRAAEWFTRVFIQGSFYPLLSLLFGLSFSLQLRKGEKMVWVFQRRLGILLGIGLIHAIFIWSGDILVTYALTGFVLIPFKGHPDRVLVWWVVGLTAFSGLLLSVLNSMGNGFSQAYIGEVERIYAQGSYLEVTLQRARELGLLLAGGSLLFPQILAYFLLGLLCGRHRILEDIGAHEKFLQSVLAVSIMVALPIVGLHAAALLNPRLDAQLLETLDMVVGSPASGFSYLSGLVLLLGSSVWREKLLLLALVGRVILTSYLAQSLICTAIFYGYGGGLYGKLNPAWGMALGISIFSLQILFSRWWLLHYRYGPVEWVWRSLTYGNQQRNSLKPMRDKA